MWNSVPPSSLGMGYVYFWYWLEVGSSWPPVPQKSTLPFLMAVLDEGLGDHLLAPGGRRALVRLEQPVAGRGGGEVGERAHVVGAAGDDVLGHAGVGDLRLVDARLAQALHAQQDDFEARGLGGVRTARHAAAEVVPDGHGLLGPVAGQRLDRPRRDAALGGGPLRRLGDAVFLTQHVGLHLVEAHRMGVDVRLVVGALGDPHVHERELQRRVGVGKHGDPLVGVDRGGVVEIGVDVDLLDADLAPEEEEAAGELAAEAPGGRLGVAAPDDDHVAVLADVLHDVVGRAHHPDEALAPDVLGPPVPALPAVRVADLLGEAAHLVEEQRGAAVRGVDHLALAVAVGLHEDGQGAVLLVDPADLGGDQVGRLVPADAHELALAAVLRVPLAVGVPVDPLERVLDPVGRVGPLLVGEAPRRRDGLHQRLERLAVLLDLPGVEGLGVVLRVPVQRPDPDDLAVLDVHGARAGAEDAAAQAERLEDGLLRARLLLIVRHAVHSAPSLSASSTMSPR